MMALVMFSLWMRRGSGRRKGKVSLPFYSFPWIIGFLPVLMCLHYLV